MRGHVAKNHGRYFAVLELGYQAAQRCASCKKRAGWVSEGFQSSCPRCGGELGEHEERRQRWLEGHQRKKDAQACLNTVLAEMQQGTYVQPSRQTLAEFAAEWIPAVKVTVRESTWASYRSNLTLHVLPKLGHLQLRSLSASHLNSQYAELLESGRRDGKGLSPRTVQYVHVILHRCLKDAVRWGRLARNPADFADPPRHTRPELSVWGTGELRAFLKHVRDDRLYALFLLAATSGMRRGELLGIRWSDLDLDKKRLQVRQTLVITNYRPHFSQPKTARSRRSISLDPGTVVALCAHRARQLEERLQWGAAWTDSGLVFTREDGSLIHPQSVSDAFEAHARRAGLPAIRFHDLRHTFATIALSAGTHPTIVSDRLGHASIAITLDSYFARDRGRGRGGGGQGGGPYSRPFTEHGRKMVGGEGRAHCSRTNVRAGIGP